MRNGDTSVLYRAISMLSANDTIIMPFKTSASAHGQAYSAKNRLVHKKESRKVEMRFCPACNQLKFARIIGVHTRRRGIGPVGCAGLRLAIIRRALRLAVRRHSSRRRGCAPGGRALAARRRAGGRVFCGATRLRRKGLRRRAFPFRLRRWLGLFGRLCARRLRLKLHAAVRAERGAVFHRFSAKWTLHHHTPPLKSKVS